MKSVIAIFAAFFTAAALGANNITHHANADFFSYVADGPIGSGWREDLPPENIPGGVNPSNAVTRLTDEETRHAFVGTFEAYFRRYLASHAFGTAETEEYSLDGSWSTNDTYRIESPDDWKTDETTKKLIDTNLGNNPVTNGWAYATNRVYAATNITLAVTNWVGWTTNVVRLTNGHYRVTISNRYEVTLAQVPDTSRILETYRDAHDYLRGAHTIYLPNNPNGLAKLIDIRPGGDHYATPEDVDYASWAYRWPKRREIQTWETACYWYTNRQYGIEQVELRTNHWLQAKWPESVNIGWSWSQVASYADIPQGLDPFALDNGGNWVDKLSDLLSEDSWGWLFPTTWDIWGRQHSRKKISEMFAGIANIDGNGLFGYEWQCPDDWDDLFALIERAPMMVEECLETNHYVIVHTNLWGNVVETNEYDLIQPVESRTAGYEMLTNLVEICPAEKPWAYTRTNIVQTATGLATNVEEAVVSNLQDRVHIVPNVETFKRINWTEWAGTAGFLALTDTALIGPEAMPSLKYDNVWTNADIVVDYATPTGQTSHIIIHGWGEVRFGDNLGWHWAATGMVSNVGRIGQIAAGGDGVAGLVPYRAEAVVVGDAGMSATGYYSPGETLDDSGEYDDGVGINCVLPSRLDHVRMLSRLAAFYDDAGPTPLAVGDVVFLDYKWSEEGQSSILAWWGTTWVWGWVEAERVSEYDVDIPWSGGAVVDEFPGDLYLQLDHLDIRAHCNVGVNTTMPRPRPYQYNLNKSAYTNSIPCCYPHPHYAGNDKIDKVQEIKASALSVIASTTNCYNYGGGEWGWGLGEFLWDTNGYRFAACSADSLETSKEVDGFFMNQVDFELDEMLKGMVSAETGIRPTTNMAAVANQVASKIDTAILDDYGAGVSEWINEAINAPGGETNLAFSISTYYDPCLVQITSITPNPDFYGDPYNPSEWYDITYQAVRPQIATNSQGILYYEWIPTDEKLRRCWSGNFSVYGITNEFITAGGIAAQGRIHGVESVKWDFQSMKRARDLK